MSNRQARIARKARQREGLEVFIHVKPTKRVFIHQPNNPAPMAGTENPPRSGSRERKRRERLYGETY